MKNAIVVIIMFCAFFSAVITWVYRKYFKFPKKVRVDKMTFDMLCNAGTVMLGIKKNRFIKPGVMILVSDDAGRRQLFKCLEKRQGLTGTEITISMPKRYTKPDRDQVTRQLREGFQ